MTLEEQAYQHGREDGLRLTQDELQKKAIWWVELLFNLQKFEYMKNGNDDKVAEIDVVQKYIVEKLKGENK